MCNTDKDFSKIAELATDPLRFIKLFWPGMQLYDKQLDVLLSVELPQRPTPRSFPQQSSSAKSKR